jgi:uncharacterized protein
MKVIKAMNVMKTLRRFCLCALALCLSTTLYGAAGVPLVDAAKNMDKAAIEKLIAQRVDVNAADVDGATALHWAAYNDDLPTVQLLIGKGAKVATANRYGVSPLSLACGNGNGAMVRVLLNAGANPNDVLHEGETSLMIAARAGGLDAVKALIAKGANVNAADQWRGQTALMWAAAEGNADVVRALVESGARTDTRSNTGFTAFLFAAREGRIESALALLDAGVKVDETLIRRRSAAPDAPSAPGPTALMLAVSNAHYELAARLLEKGANADADTLGWTTLHQITWVRKPGAGGNNPAPNGSGSVSSLEMVEKLVKHGANVNARISKLPNVGTTDLNLIGATPFLMAARTADAELMRLLARLGADPLLANVDDTTPLQAAAGVGTRSPGEDPGTESEVLEAVKVAYALGGSLNTVDKNGQTAMHGAAYKQVPSVAEFLIANGANIAVWNAKNKNGWTPLRIAAGVHRGMNFRDSPAVAAILRRALTAAGLSTEVEPEGTISGRTK